MQINDSEFEFLRKLISIRSVGSSPEPGCPYGRNSRKALDVFLQDADSKGFMTGVIDDKVGYVEFGNGRKMIGIVCHLDVVPEGSGWDTDPFEMTVRDGVIYARGIVDDKGPACAAYFAMQRLMAEGIIPDARIRLILGTDEERTCDCVETYAAKGEIPDFAITPDAEFPAIFAEKGILHLKISGANDSQMKAKAGNAANMVPNEASLETDGITYAGKGKTAHASMPHLGSNAIMDLISKLGNDAYDKSHLLSFIRDCIFGRDASEYTGISFTDVSGSITANPAILRIGDGTEDLTIDIRYPISAEMEDITDHFRRIAVPYGLSVEVISHMASLFKDKDADEIRLLTGIWAKYMSRYDGYKPEYKDKYTSPLAIGGGTYARHMPNTVAFGLTPPWQEDQCHQANEHMSVNDFAANVELLKETILTLS